MYYSKKQNKTLKIGFLIFLTHRKFEKIKLRNLTEVGEKDDVRDKKGNKKFKVSTQGF